MAALVNNKPDLVFSYLGGNLIVTDTLEEYDDINMKNFICLEFLAYNDDISNIRNITINENLNSKEDIESSTFTLSQDGTHAYYRFIIPRVKKYANSGIIKPYNLFYYNENFYYSTVQVSWLNVDVTDESKFQKVSLKDIYSKLEEGLATDGDNEVMYSKYIIFSYELLKKAFVKAQDNLQNSTSIKEMISFNWRQKGRDLRDLLLNNIFAVREYIKRELYKEAHILINSIEESKCLGIIDNNSSSGKTTCGCSIKLQNNDSEIKYLSKITDDDLSVDNIGWTFGSQFPIRLI